MGIHETVRMRQADARRQAEADAAEVQATQVRERAHVRDRPGQSTISEGQSGPWSQRVAAPYQVSSGLSPSQLSLRPLMAPPVASRVR